MAIFATEKRLVSDYVVVRFLLLWTLINLLQSYFTELHPDEAYYWIYAKFLDWGYFDHPPMVALFIRFGDSIFHNELCLRLLTVFTGSFSWWILWQILKNYKVEASWFILVLSSVSIFHIFGFTTTPDAPLFFFSTLFYFFYQQYLKKDTLPMAILLALALSGALYSKYHAVLLVVFTLIANPKLLRRKSFWLIASLTLILFLPHIFWQISHGFPSVKYHLIERSASHYELQFTYLFIIGQLFMAGPLVSWFWFYQVGRLRSKDIFTKTLLFNFLGTQLFFLISTWKGVVQPHWTLIGFLPLVMLVLISIQNKTKPSWLKPLLYVNILLLLLMRLGLTIKNPVSMKIGVVKSYFGNPQWASAIKQKAGNSYVVFPDQFQDPSWYNYYTNSLKGVAYDSHFYRRTQFDIWPLEDSLQQKRAYFVTDDADPKVKTDTLHTPKGTFYGRWIDSLRTYQKITVETNVKQLTAKSGKPILFNLKITNPYAFPVSFSNQNQAHIVVLRAYIMQNDAEIYTQLAPPTFNQLQLKSGETKNFPFLLKTPVKPGMYTLIFSVKTPPFAGPRSSRFIYLNLK